MRVIQECTRGEGWLTVKVESKSHAGTFHEVLLPPWDLDGDEGVCDCEGFRFNHGKCSHIEKAKKQACRWNELDSDEQQNTKQRDQHICPACGNTTRDLYVNN